MFTRNYNNLIIRNIYENGDNVPTGYEDGKIGIKVPSGDIFPAWGTYTHNSVPQWIDFLGDALYWGTSSPIDNGRRSYIWVGEGNASESYEDYTLESPVDANSLTYGPHSRSDLAYDSNEKAWYKDISRYFLNKSGRTLNIKEACIMRGTDGGYGRYALINRKVLSEPISVNNGDFFTITFRIYLKEGLFS